MSTSNSRCSLVCLLLLPQLLVPSVRLVIVVVGAAVLLGVVIVVATSICNCKVCSPLLLRQLLHTSLISSNVMSNCSERFCCCYRSYQVMMIVLRIRLSGVN